MISILQNEKIIPEMSERKKDRKPSPVSLESAMKSKKQRTPGMSISVKLNMLVIAIVFIVSVLLILISNSAYRRAVFKSQEIKLNGIEFPDFEEVVPMLDHLQRIFETEEFQNARAEFRPGTKDAEGSSAMAAWMYTQPGWYQLESGAGSMLFDWLIVAEYADIFWENNALKSVRIDVQKDGKAWHIYERAINEEDTIKFDYVGEAATWYPESETDSFRSAALTQIGDSHLCLRCIRDKMEGGGEYCI